jgi:hypothetical protein
MDEKISRAGEICKISGQYAIVDEREKPTGEERTVIRNKPFPPTPQKNFGYRLVDATNTRKKKAHHSKQVTGIVIYYLIILFISFWLLLDTWSKQFTVLRWAGFEIKGSTDPVLLTIGYTLIGGILGSLLYHIRVLFYFYAQKKCYDPDWLGKYITAPWEGAGMALVVLSLIRGGLAVFGGAASSDVTSTGNFAAFGIGALVGFGMRDVIGWIGNLIQTMFTIDNSKKIHPLSQNLLEEQDQKENDDVAKSS